MPATVQRPRTRPVIRRVARLLEVLGATVLEIDVTTGKRLEQASYTLDRLPAPEGALALVRLVKLTDPDRGQSYAVLCAASPEGDSCECKGWLRWGRCKHRDIVRLLAETGRLPT